MGIGSKWLNSGKMSYHSQVKCSLTPRVYIPYTQIYFPQSSSCCLLFSQHMDLYQLLKLGRGFKRVTVSAFR